MTTLTTELIRDPALLPDLAAAWAALWRRSHASPFQHPAWLLPWWEQFGTGAPRIALLRNARGALLGLLPLYDSTTERKILPIGAGLSDYCDAVLALDAPPEAADRLLREALMACNWPCHLSDMPPDAALRRIAAPPGWTMMPCAGEPCPVLHPFDVPPRQRRKLRMARNRAARIGGYAVVAGGTLTPALSQREMENCPLSLWERAGVRVPPATLFGDLTRLHTQVWQARGESGVLVNPHVQAFHQAAIPLLDRAGLLHLRALRFGAKTVAVIYALSAPGRLYMYLSGFDPAHSFESPGTILLGAMLDEATTAGVGEIHFLRGAEAYKYAWGATDRLNATLLLERT